MSHETIFKSNVSAIDHLHRLCQQDHSREKWKEVIPSHFRLPYTKKFKFRCCQAHSNFPVRPKYLRPNPESVSAGFLAHAYIENTWSLFKWLFKKTTDWSLQYHSKTYQYYSGVCYQSRTMKNLKTTIQNRHIVNLKIWKGNHGVFIVESSAPAMFF